METQSLLQSLAWDTERLGIKVGRIMPEPLTEVALQNCLSEAKRQQLQLLYFCIPESFHDTINAVKNCGGVLVDHKVTYLVELAMLQGTRLVADGVTPYINTEPNTALISLAFESGKYSRFRNDLRLNEQQFQAIYREWITNSTNHQVADAVMVVQQNENILGMVTVGAKNNRGDIGLLAVAETARGKQIGSKLVNAALKYFIDHGFTQSQVVTQQENVPACRLYEKCGYHVEKVEYFFHIWL